MKYGVYVLVEDPQETEKSLSVLMDESQSRGWEECNSSSETEAIVRNMIEEGHSYVGKREINSGPSGEGAEGGRWGFGLYFLKEAK